MCVGGGGGVIIHIQDLLSTIMGMFLISHDFSRHCSTNDCSGHDVQCGVQFNIVTHIS